MKSTRTLTFLIVATLFFPCLRLHARSAPSRSVLSADADWKFYLGDQAGAESSTFDDGAWRTVTIPHDWSIEQAPAKENPSGSSGGYFATGIGWYRKTFTAPSDWIGKRVSLEFDGVSANATVFLNGNKVGFHPYAYTSFRFDITSQIKSSAKNILVVRVDNSMQPSSRWFAGSGIYRHVRVVLTDPVHIAPWGVFVSTPEVSSDLATIKITTQVKNDTPDDGNFSVKTVLIAPSGTRSSESVVAIAVQSKQLAEAKQEIALSQPLLWSPRTPHLYRAITQILRNGRVLDEVSTSFGVRSLAWSVDKGLLLNGQPIKLAGGSVHHDNGPLGAAAFDRAEERKVQLLKAAGFNAVRTAHNPPSPAFLDAADRLGLLVLDEPFDVWTVSKRKYDYAQFFHEWWKEDIDSMVMRDRNHPSIIMWGIGNEIPEVWTPDGAPLAKQIAERVRSLDSTRPLTQAFPGATFGPNPDAAIDQVDIAGYNYNLAQNQAEDHKRVPARIMMTTESFPTDAFEQWKLVQDHSYILGEFVWTAMDYLGESGIGAWSYGEPKQAAQLSQLKGFLRSYMAKMGADGKNPMAPFQNGQPASPMAPGFPWHAAYCGDLDLTGFRKPWSYYRDILWNGGDRVFATVRLPEPEGKKILAAAWAVYPTVPSWTWPGLEGKPLTVEVYSGTERVRLFLNDKLIGEKATGPNEAFTAGFQIPYTPGTLRVEGIRGGHVVAQSILETAGKPVRLKITADRTVLSATGEDLSFISVEAVDAKGRLLYDSSVSAQFSISGAGIIAAVGSGDGQSLESYQGSSFRLFQGRALVVVRSTRREGKIRFSARADGMNSQPLIIESSRQKTSSELQ
jgi:beta-galactosidase